MVLYLGAISLGVVFSSSGEFGLGVGFFPIKMVMSRVTYCGVLTSCLLGRDGDGLTGTRASCLWCAIYAWDVLFGW